MMKRRLFFIFPVLLAIAVSAQATEVLIPEIKISTAFKKQAFPIFDGKRAASIYFDLKDAAVVGIAARCFQNDLKLVTGVTAPLNNDDAKITDLPIIFGTLGQSRFIDKLVAANKLDSESVRGQWEKFIIYIVANPLPNVKQALVVVGADRRGTAFGIFELSRMMGVSPFYWWADVKPAHKNTLYAHWGRRIEQSPSIKYRGIFLNDEDWGLQPWAAKKMDPKIKDIGPNTYTKIFELLLRLKANYIWPAMHPCTKAFYYYPQNPVAADKYAIVVGGSHCEPMLRNNVFEWAENFEHEYGKKPGEWRYDLNKPEMDRYWDDRIKQSKNYESVYTVGMRGIHDGSMPGPKDKNEKVKLLGSVIKNQRDIFANNFSKPVSSVPQIFCPYKEVLSLYRAGLDLPDDVTIVWADDNHGYIRQLSNEQEQKRSGGSGVYYHLSYWGAPNDYLWLSSISPSLISFEMSKAYAYGASRLWVFNVGDIKPAEMEIQFSMDLAWDVKKWKPEDSYKYAEFWAAETFGAEFAKEIGEVKAEYYRLTQRAKPEHTDVAWLSTRDWYERAKAFQAITKKSDAVMKRIPARLQDAYFELVHYPVYGAYLMDKKTGQAKESLEYAENGSRESLTMAKNARQAFDSIGVLTAKYNALAGGKWSGIMSAHPRDRDVFKMPKVATAEMIKGRNDDYNKLSSVNLIHASTYITKRDTGGLKIVTIPGLGLDGNGQALLPVNARSVDEADLLSAPYLEYQATPRSSTGVVSVRCLPTQAVYAGKKLRYAISVNGDKPQVVNIVPETENDKWKSNVLTGSTSTNTSHHGLPSNSTVTVRLYLLDPGIVINQLELN